MAINALNDETIRHIIYGNCSFRINFELRNDLTLNANAHIISRNVVNHFRLNNYLATENIIIGGNVGNRLFTLKPTSEIEARKVVVLLDDLKNFGGNRTWHCAEGTVNYDNFNFTGAHVCNIRKLYQSRGGVKRTNNNGTVKFPEAEELETLLRDLRHRNENQMFNSIGKNWSYVRDHNNTRIVITCNTNGRISTWSLNVPICPIGNNIRMC